MVRRCFPVTLWWSMAKTVGSSPIAVDWFLFFLTFVFLVVIDGSPLGFSFSFYSFGSILELD